MLNAFIIFIQSDGYVLGPGHNLHMVYMHVYVLHTYTHTYVTINQSISVSRYILYNYTFINIYIFYTTLEKAYA